MNTTRDISKLSQISLAQGLVKLSITILKYHLWYVCQISLQIMLLPILISSGDGLKPEPVKIETCRRSLKPVPWTVSLFIIFMFILRIIYFSDIHI